MQEAEVGMTPCQNFIGAVRSNGYGLAYFGKSNGKRSQLGAHRLAWALHNGGDPGDMVVRHLCHNRACLNPEHLAIGTVQDNTNDRVNAGRQLRGTDIVTSKLNDAEILHIRELLDKGVRQAEIAGLFGVSQGAVSAIKRGRSWKHV